MPDPIVTENGKAAFGVYPPLVAAMLSTTPKVWTSDEKNVPSIFPNAYKDFQIYNSIADNQRYDVLIENPNTKVKETKQYFGYEIKKSFALVSAVAYQGSIKPLSGFSEQNANFVLLVNKTLYDMEGRPFISEDKLIPAQLIQGNRKITEANAIWDGALNAAHLKRAKQNSGVLVNDTDDATIAYFQNPEGTQTQTPDLAKLAAGVGINFGGGMSVTSVQNEYGNFVPRAGTPSASTDMSLEEIRRNNASAFAVSNVTGADGINSGLTGADKNQTFVEKVGGSKYKA